MTMIIYILPKTYINAEQNQENCTAAKYLSTECCLGDFGFNFRYDNRPELSPVRSSRCRGSPFGENSGVEVDQKSSFVIV
jgi:hypothetical protein